MNTTQDYSKSVIREKMLLHIFLADIYKWAWSYNDVNLEILHSEVDDSGYDIVVSINGKMKFIQLKGVKIDGITKFFNLNEKLANKAGATLIVINYSHTRDSFEVSYQYSEINKDVLGTLKTAKHAKANSLGVKNERKGIKKLPIKYLSKRLDITKLIEALFIK